MQALGLNGDQSTVVSLGEDVHAGVGQIGKLPWKSPASQRSWTLLPAPSAGDLGGWNLHKRLDQLTLEPLAFVGVFEQRQGEYALAEGVARGEIRFQIDDVHPHIIPAYGRRSCLAA